MEFSAPPAAPECKGVWTFNPLLTTLRYSLAPTSIAALLIACSLAGGAPAALSAAAAAGKLRVFDFRLDLAIPYTFLGGLIGGGMLTAASHGTDQLIVQRLLASQSLGNARRALVGSGIVVLAQFTLFMLIGTAIWSAAIGRSS